MKRLFVNNLLWETIQYSAFLSLWRFDMLLLMKYERQKSAGKARH